MDTGNKETIEKYVKVEGDPSVPAQLAKNLTEFDFFFNVVEP